MRNNDASVLLAAGMSLMIIGALSADVDRLGQMALLSCGSCLLFIAAAMAAGIVMFERVMAKALKFLEWFQRCLRG